MHPKPSCLVLTAADPGEYGPIFQQFNDLFESGPSRLMGDWPESHFADTD